MPKQPLPPRSQKDVREGVAHPTTPSAGTFSDLASASPEQSKGPGPGTLRTGHAGSAVGAPGRASCPRLGRRQMGGPGGPQPLLLSHTFSRVSAPMETSPLPRPFEHRGPPRLALGTWLPGHRPRVPARQVLCWSHAPAWPPGLQCPVEAPVTDTRVSQGGPRSPCNWTPPGGGETGPVHAFLPPHPPLWSDSVTHTSPSPLLHILPSLQRESKPR